MSLWREYFNFNTQYSSFRHLTHISGDNLQRNTRQLTLRDHNDKNAMHCSIMKGNICFNKFKEPYNPLFFDTKNVQLYRTEILPKYTVPFN